METIETFARYFWIENNQPPPPAPSELFRKSIRFDTVTRPLGEGGQPCFRIGGLEDNFIIYIEYCFFFVPMMKSR